MILEPQLVSELERLVADTTIPDPAIRGQLSAILDAHAQRKPPKRAELTRLHLVEL